MKTENAIPSKWMRRASGLLATMMLIMSFAGQASAMILFQDDTEHDIDSEGITINADDGGDEDVVLQFGNDTTDATITFDDGLSDLIFSGAGMDWSAVDQFRIRENADPASNSACDFKGELIYDTTDDQLQICTATGVAGVATWAAVDTGGSNADTLDTLDSTDFIRATASDAFGDGGTYTLTIGADDTINVLGTLDADGTVTLGDGGDVVTINGTTGNWDLTDLDFDVTGNPSEITLVSDGAADDLTVEVTGATDSSLVLQSTGTGADAVDINTTAGGITVDSAAGVSIDGAGASNFTTSSGALTLDGNGGVNIAGNAAEVDVTTTGAVDINSGAFTLDGSTVSLDGTDNSNLTITANDAANKTLTISATNAGAGAGYVSIGSDTWNISSAGVATGFTGITSTGVIDFSGSSRLALHSGGTTPTPCTEGDIFYNTGNNTTYVCTATGNPGTWSALSSGSTPDFEAVYATDADKVLTASSTFGIDATGAITVDSDAGVTIGGSSIGLTADGGILSLTGDGTNDIDILNTGAAIDIGSATYTLDTTSSFSIDGAGTASNISLASDGAADDLTVEVTGATDSSLVLQSTGTGTDAVDINATAGGVDIDGATASSFTTAAGAITVSGGDGVNIDGTGQEVDITTTGGAVDVNSASFTLDTTGTFSIDGAGASNVTTSSGALTLDGNGGVNIAGNAAEVDVTTTGAVDINSGAFTLDASTATLTTSSTFGVDSTGAVTIDSDAATTLGGSTVGIDSDGGAVSINNNVNQAVNIGTGTSSGLVTIGGGSGTAAINTTSWDVSSAGVGSGFTGFTSTGVVNFSGASSFRIREVAGITNPGTTCTTVGELIMDTTNNVLYTCINAGTNAWTSTSAKVDTMVFEPEYPNYVLWGDGSDNNGKMEALYDSTNREHYYRWTTTKSVTHDYDVRFRYTLPDDYVSAGNMTLRFRNDSITLATDNWVNVTVRNDTDGVGGTTCHADGEVQATAANTWETLTITGAEIETGCTGGTALNPGDVIEVIIKMGADNVPNSGGTDVGTLSFAYTN